ncbi:hypothetical protein SAMN05421508_101627 [Caenispirillum bisanense]|uniref:Uncharacterized protein n=1 Tax=Caenispirillum bisanense TaxID=414052 RepID=A0A286G581_9PROT|nr:hypothetical protein SAMN05421508_101627 [Caenispirillum bisanense]
MREMFRRSIDGAILCRSCLPASDVTVSAELFADLFPGTWHLVTCGTCGYASPEGDAAVTAGAGEEPPAGSRRSV